MQGFYYLPALYWRIILLRAKPQDVPASPAVLGVSVAAALLTYITAIATEFGVLEAFLRATLDLAILLAVLHGGLKITGHPKRFVQGYAALCGTAALINLAFWPIFLLITASQSPDAGNPFAYFLLLWIYVWSVLVIGHIFRHCFDTRLAVGMLVSILYLLASITLANSLFPPMAVPGGTG